MAFAWIGIDSRLIYHWQFFSFSTMPGFAAEFFAYPGGPAEYAARLLAQGCANRWLGALLIAGQCAAFAAASHLYFRLVAGRAIGFLRYIPAAMALCLINMYDQRLTVVPSLLVGLLLACSFLWALRRVQSQWLLLAVFVVELVLGYYLAAIAIVLFAPAAAIAQLWRRPARPVGLLYLILAAALPMAAQYCQFPYLDQFPYVEFGYKFWLLPMSTGPLPMNWLVFLFFPLASVLLLGQERLRRAGRLLRRKILSRRTAVADKGDTPAPPAFAKRRHVMAGIGAILPLAGLSALAAFSHHATADIRRQLKMDYYAYHEQWENVIDFSRELSADDYQDVTCYDVDLALHMTGRMGDEMFAFPQRRGLVLTNTGEEDLRFLYRLSDMSLRLGWVNDAEHFAQEALTIWGPNPRVLRLLVRANLVKCVPAARRYLHALAYDLVEGGWAREWLAQLDRDSTLSGNAEIRRWRRQALRLDDRGRSEGAVDEASCTNSQQAIEAALMQDKGNRMAFEFLMGECLLASDLKAARKLMPRIKDMSGPAYMTRDGRRRTPRHYQEAMAVYADKYGQRVQIEGFEIEAATLERMEEFKRIVAACATRKEAYAATREKFRDTYFFYNLFGPGDHR